MTKRTFIKMISKLKKEFSIDISHLIKSNYFFKNIVC